jgi:hypothetical protein
MSFTVEHTVIGEGGNFWKHHTAGNETSLKLILVDSGVSLDRVMPPKAYP